jgi:hypothetical protein
MARIRGIRRILSNELLRYVPVLENVVVFESW